MTANQHTSGYTRIGPELYEVYLASIRQWGSYAKAADSINAFAPSVAKYRKEHPEFQELIDAALEDYRAMIVAAAQKRAVEGYLVPIVGGRERNEVVTHETRFSDTLMQMFLRRTDPEFREKSHVEVSGVSTFREMVDYRSLSKRARAKLRELLEICKEDDIARAQGETVE